MAEYEINFDLNFDADYDADGYTPYLPDDAPVKYAKGDEVVFYVAVSEDYNKSDVQYVFKASNASAGAGQVIDKVYDDTQSAYKYTFIASASGTVTAGRASMRKILTRFPVSSRWPTGRSSTLWTTLR